MFTEKDIERFNKKTERDGDCVVWTGAKTKFGYGVFRKDGKNILAHRVSFIIHYGENALKTNHGWLSKVYVCHKCNNPSCVNPEHLYAGNAETNAKDRVESNAKNPRRYKPPNSKLSADDVISIRKNYSNKRDDIIECMLKYDVSYTTALNVISGKSWRGLS